MFRLNIAVFCSVFPRIYEMLTTDRFLRILKTRQRIVQPWLAGPGM